MRFATLTSLKIKQSKGVLDIGMDSSVQAFREKGVFDGMSINAGHCMEEMWNSGRAPWKVWE